MDPLGTIADIIIVAAAVVAAVAIILVVTDLRRSHRSTASDCICNQPRCGGGCNPNRKD